MHQTQRLPVSDTSTTSVRDSGRAAAPGDTVAPMSAHPDDAPGTPDTPDGPAPLADAGDLGPAREHAEDLAAFVTASPSSFHAAAETARRLRAAGFVEQHEDEAWDAPDSLSDTEWRAHSGWDGRCDPNPYDEEDER